MAERVIVGIEASDLDMEVIDYSNLGSKDWKEVVAVEAKESTLKGQQREGFAFAWVGNSFDWKVDIAFGWREGSLFD